MKARIIQYLQSDRSFDSGVAIYMQFGKNLAFKTVLNRQGYSEYNHNILLEELRKLAGIGIQEYGAIIGAPVAAEKKSAIIPDQEDAAGDNERKKFVNEIPDEIRKTIRLREEFPFLTKSDCPNELKILVADRITAYHKYVEAHKKLFTALTDQELSEASASVVENYLENCQIWDELKYYKETGTLLKQHPIFAEQDRIREIQAMTTAELVKLKKSLENNLARNKQKVKEQPNHPETAGRINRIENYQVELNEVNRLLGINA